MSEEPTFVPGNVNITDLPDNVMKLVFSYFTTKELSTVVPPCHRWKKLMDNDERWHRKAMGAGVLDFVVFDNDGSGNWRKTASVATEVEERWLQPTGTYTTRVLKGHKDDVWKLLKMGPDRLLSASSDRTVKVWDVENYTCLRTLKGHKGGVWALHYDAANGVVCTGDTDGFVRIWNCQTWELSAEIEAHPTTVSCIQVDGNTLITGSFDNSVSMWDLDTLQRKSSLHGADQGAHTFHIWCMKLVGNKLVTGSWDTTIKVWDLTTHTCSATLRGHTGPVRCIDFDGKRVTSGGWDGDVMLWSLPKANTPLSHTLSGHTGPVAGVCLDRHKVVSTSYDMTTRVWNLQTTTPACARSLKEHTAPVLCVETDWRRLYSGGKDKKIKVLDFSMQ